MTHVEVSPVFLMNKSYSRPPTHAPSSCRPRPSTAGALKESFLRQASEFVPPLLRGSKCIRPIFSSYKGREWNGPLSPPARPFTLAHYLRKIPRCDRSPSCRGTYLSKTLGQWIFVHIDDLREGLSALTRVQQHKHKAPKHPRQHTR